MMNALGAIDTKGNIVLEQFQDGTALLFQPGKDSTYDKASETIRANADIDIAERRKSVLPDQAGLAAKKASCIESLAHIGGNAPVCGQDEIAR